MFLQHSCFGTPTMKISRIIVKDFQQFKLLDLDLTDPQTGQALDKVCFIGRNGTGKSTLLRIVKENLGRVSEAFRRASNHPELHRLCRTSLIGLKFQVSGGGFWLIGTAKDPKPICFVCGEDADQTPDWADLMGEGTRDKQTTVEAIRRLIEPEPKRMNAAERLAWHSDAGAILVYVPPDAEGRLPPGQRVPKTNLDQALKRFKEFPLIHEVSTSNAAAFWEVLIYHIKKREEEWQNFLQQPENRVKSVEDAERDFRKSHPEILAAVATLWNRMLEPAGLEFDYFAAKKPVQLRDNLEASITVKSSGISLDYNALSSGIRTFLFRLGHILGLYFQRNIERGFLLLDEPENSLFPDFLYDQIEIYEEIIRNTQFFVATHSPIVAAQFRPEERVILEFDETYHVRAKKGVSPVGDDPNDVLEKDFEVRSIYGSEGLKQWERFLELRRTIKQQCEPARKRALIEEYMQIGNAYNFPADAIP
jgi:hypothetical protein